MRILGLDVGEKKIGISLSDSTCSIAQALKLYRRTTLEKDLKELKQVAEEHRIGEIVIGLPKDWSVIRLTVRICREWNKDNNLHPYLRRVR